MAAIFGDFRKFLPKLAKHKFASISLDPLCEIERFRRNHSISHRVSKEIEANLCFAIFGKNFRKFPKMAAIFGDFRKFLPKLAKHKFASISLDTLCEIERFRRNRSISHG